MARIFLEAGAATRPVPRGAGIKRTETLPQVPLNFIGICVKNCEHKIVSKSEQDAPRFRRRFFYSVRQPTILPPVASTNRHEVHLGHDESAANSRGNFRRALLAEADVAIEIANSNVGLCVGSKTVSFGD